MVYLDRFDQDVLGPYFQSPDWPDVSPPRQEYPPIVENILEALELTVAPGWLAGNSALRDLGSEGRKQVEEMFTRVVSNVFAKEWTHFAMAGRDTLVFVLSRSDGVDRSQLARAQAQAYGLAASASVRLFELSVTPHERIARATSSVIAGAELNSSRLCVGSCRGGAPESEIREALNLGSPSFRTTFEVGGGPKPTPRVFSRPAAPYPRRPCSPGYSPRRGGSAPCLRRSCCPPPDPPRPCRWASACDRAPSRISAADN